MILTSLKSQDSFQDRYSSGRSFWNLHSLEGGGADLVAEMCILHVTSTSSEQSSRALKLFGGIHILSDGLEALGTGKEEA